MPVSSWHRKSIERCSAAGTTCQTHSRLNGCALREYNAKADAANKQRTHSTMATRMLEASTQAASHQHCPFYRVRGVALPVSAEFTAISSRQAAGLEQLTGRGSGDVSANITATIERVSREVQGTLRHHWMYVPHNACEFCAAACPAFSFLGCMGCIRCVKPSEALMICPQ